MKKTITIGLNSASIKQAIKELEAYKKWVDTKTKELTKRLAEIGLEEASIKFMTAWRETPTIVSCSIVPTDNGYKITAQGDDVCFIEFGAGVHFNGTDSYPGTRPPTISNIGEYGKGHGKEDSWIMPNEYGSPVTRNGKVVPGASWTNGTPASAPMWTASETIKKQLSQIAKEVFSS